ncbi:oligosaccharide flippase family protein [Flavobacterium sp. NRK F10]|uniref:lipopolysaccharide biosynthesis protein n=1 Tax=Flavobacterium sp. NRK F10 TaxID=2954931 RepID=UPI002090ED51|nr:oligosaccharide flippase family protein [Flavobacterium sp. NRK F10]MCO6174216.1 oligosaccharide flippase family protein [Flavobacterium sp. NRK F10]
MKTSGSLLSTTIIYTIGNLATKGLSFVLVFFTTFYLTQAEVGELDLFLVTVSLLTPFVTFQLTDSILRWLIEDKSEENISGVLTVSTALVLLGIFLLALLKVVVSFFYPVPYANYIFALLFFQSFYLLFQQFQRAVGDNKGYVVSSIVYTLVYVVLSVFFLVVLDWKLEGLLLANTIAAFISLLYVVLKNKIFQYLKKESFSWSLAKQLWQFSLPLVPNNVSWWAISSANRYLILLFLGASANGIFAIAYKLPTIVLLLINVFYLAWQEKAIAMYADKERDLYYTRILGKYVVFLFSVSIVIVGCNKVFLTHFVSADFYDSWEYTALLLVGIVFNALAGFYGTGYLSAKKTSGALSSSIAGGLVVIAISYMTIPKYGLYGASFAITIGYLILFLMRLWQTKSYFNIQFPIVSFVKMLLAFILISLANYWEIEGIQYLLPVVSLLFVWWINRQDVSLLYQKIKAKLP